MAETGLQPVEQPEPWPRRRRTVLALALAGCAVILAAAGWVGRRVTERPEFCAACHEMRPSYEQWVCSSHYQPELGVTATCQDCHVAPGFTGALQSKLRGLVHVYRHLTEPWDPIRWEADRLRRQQVARAQIANEACIRCHKPPEIAPALTTVDHTKVGPRSRCVDCHRNLMTGRRPAIRRLAHAIGE